MASIDDITEKYRKYLTGAQIQKLVEAQGNYERINAGNRADAQSQLRQQYDTGYRGLQNMGLAGSNGQQPTSGEVPRLQQQIITPFDRYNQKLREVEHKQLDALGGAFAKATKKRRAAEAAAAEEAAARARAAAEATRLGNAYRQTNAEFRGQVGSTTMSDPKRQRNVNMTDTDETHARANAMARAAAETAQVAYDTSSEAARDEKLAMKRAQREQERFSAGRNLSPVEKYQRDGMIRTASPQVIAAAEALGIARDANTAIPGRAANAYQERGANLTEKLKGEANTTSAITYSATGENQRQAYEAAQRDLDNLTQMRHYGGKVTEEEYKAAVEKRDYARADMMLNDPNASYDDKQRALSYFAERASDQKLEELGITKPGMTDDEYDRLANDVPMIRSLINTIDTLRKQRNDAGSTGNDQAQRLIDENIEELKTKYGMTEKQARDSLAGFDSERHVRSEYQYLKDAYKAQYQHAGEHPASPVNKSEEDATYRAVNGLEDKDAVKLMRNPTGTDDQFYTSSKQQKEKETYEGLTQEQKNAYNAIYEAQGIDAANKYLKDILPLVELQRAANDKQYLEQLAKEKKFPAWLLARITNTVASIPAMAEKLYTAGKNMVDYAASGGTNIPTRYSTDSRLSRASNWADIVQSKQSQDILNYYDEKGRPWLGKTMNFMYETGTSIADSLIAMGLAAVTGFSGGPVGELAGKAASGALFFSSSGNQAYKDAIERGATQNQAMAFSVLSGAAEVIFEEVSLERALKNVKVQGPTLAKLFKNALMQGGTEASEEVATEIANTLSDLWVMGDKAEFNRIKAEEGTAAAVKDLLKNLGMAALGGFASALGFGVIELAANAKGLSDYRKLGKQVTEYGNVKDITDTAMLLGGDAMEKAQEATKYKDAANIGEMTASVYQTLDKLDTDNDHRAAAARLVDGTQMTEREAGDVLDVLGADTVESMGYDAASPAAFAGSYNQRIEDNKIKSRSERRFDTQQDAAARVWKNPNQGYTTTEDGKRVMSLPGNMTAVAHAENERSNFKAQTTAKMNGVTLELSGMEARKGLTDAQIFDEAKKAMTKKAARKLDVYMKLAKALSMPMVIRDVVAGTSGYVHNGTLYVTLSGRQAIPRVVAHELTHLAKENNRAKYDALRTHLISEVGQEKFDQMVKDKAKKYGLDLSTEEGRVEADDEVCAELCERMLSNPDSLERFAEKDTAAAITLRDHLLKILNAIKAALKDPSNRVFSDNSGLIKQQETIESWYDLISDAIKNANERAQTNEGRIAQTAGVTTADQDNLISDLEGAKTDADIDNAIAEHSVDVIEYDMAGYRQDLVDSGLMSNRDLDSLFDTMNKAIDMVKAHRAILDYGAELTSAEEIENAKKNRAYLPYKQNADPHYKLALDFSTLCRKRVLLQSIQERLQAKMGRALTQEETVAIRLELQKLQREGMKVEVACALCYVEAARLKSPKVINAFLNNTANEMRNYFAKKNPASKKIIEGMQQQWKVDHGLAPDATKNDMKAAGVSVDAFNQYSRDIREQFEGNADEAEIIARAVDLVKNHREVFLSASELTKLKKANPDIFNAFTDKVRSATRSKAQETDTFYSRGDIDMVSEAILNYANAESGFRHQSWSDFVPTHLLDTMAAVIEMSTKKAKMHAYTKVPSMVRLLGKTGMALNMSLIPSGNTGIDANGNLSFDAVEGMPWETMLQLRDMFPETAGNIAIGINDAQIQKLLESKDIDYVIPYHASGMNKNMRGYLDIRAWSEYTSSQNEKTNHRGTKGAAPELAEWFDEKAAAKAEDGEAFMRAASEKYLQLCFERNLVPKFSQYLTNNGDGSYSLKEGYENYWKMLTDRKMVNQQTGKVIIQQAVKPNFDQATVLGILEDRVNDPAIQDAAKAADIVTEKFSDWQAGKNNASAEAIQAAKDIRDRTAAITAQKTAEAGNIRNSLDDETVETIGDVHKAETFSYDNLVKQKPMVVYDMPSLGSLKTNGNIDLDKVIDMGLKNAASVGEKIGETEYSIKNRYTGSQIRLSKNAIEHGFDADDAGRLRTNVRLAAISGTIVQNAIPINAVTPKNKQASWAYVMCSLLNSGDRQFVAAVHVNQFTNAVESIEFKEVAHSVSGRITKEADRSSTRETGNNPATSAPVITINDFLDIVNNTYRSLLSKSVLDHYGEKRPTNGLFSDDAIFSLDDDAIRDAFTVIDTAGIEDGLEALRDVKHVGSFALKDISRFLDASAGKNKDLRNTLHAIFEAPHSEAIGRYARGVERMQQKVLDIGQRAGVCDAKGKHFDSKKSAAIQNIGEGFSNTYTDLKLKVKDAEHVTVQAYDPDTGKLVVSEKDYTLKELRQAYGTNAADYVWDQVFHQAEDAQATGGEGGWVEQKVNTRPYTLEDLQTAYPNDWQKLKGAADEFRQMYDEYIRDQNNMLATIYPIESEYADVEKLEAAIEKKQERLIRHKDAVNAQLDGLQKRLEAKEKEMAGKKRTDTKAYRQLVEQANKLTDRIAEVKAEIAEYEANAKDELIRMNTLKVEMQNAVQKGDYSLKRMHRLQYRSDYFHHFTEMASGIQNLKSIFTNNTDIAPAIVGKSENTRAKTKWAGYFQQRMGGDYTADALNGMLRYGQLAEYKLAFDPLTAYLRDVNKQIRDMSDDTNRDGLIRYIDQWADNIAGKSHKLDRVVSDAGLAPRKAMQVLQWINSRVIQNTLLWNMRSALVQISNITNAKGIVKNNIDWLNGLKAWAMAARGDEAMASIMAQSNFLASRYMDGLELTDSKLKSAKQFAGWMLGALDEISAKATWWAAYQSYVRNQNVAKNQYRSYDSAVDYADDVTRRTHAGRGVGELAPAMTSKVINFVAPFQVEVNNTWQLLKDNVKQKNYLGLLSTGLSVFLFNTAFEAIVGSTPLGFDFIRAVMDIVLGFTNDDKDDDPDVKSIAQRFAGELVGGLPFASQLVAAFGEDNAKKLLGENNDATRYGNTQIGVNAVVNAVKGLKDIGSGLIEGRRVNWIDDLDDLLNLTMPMGAKQLTRSAQGIITAAKGYAGKYDNKGDEKVQFVTDGDILDYIHAGLFGKWALTEASEYFGEKRLLPELFGKYNGQKSSTGNLVDAKEYKAALATGIGGKDYFTLKDDLKAYRTQAGKRTELLQQKNLTPEQKAKLDALMIVDKKKETKTSGGVVYQKNSDGDWEVKADYSSVEWMDIAELGDKKYQQARGAVAAGMKPKTVLDIFDKWKEMSGKDKKQQAREYLDSLNLPKKQYDYIWTQVFNYKAD